MSLPGKRSFSDKDQNFPCTSGDPIRPMQTPAATRPPAHAHRGRLRRPGGALPRIIPPPFFPTAHQSYDCHASVSSSRLHLLLSSSPPAAVSRQNRQVSRALVTAHSSSEFLVLFRSQLREHQGSFISTLEKKKTPLLELLTITKLKRKMVRRKNRARHLRHSRSCSIRALQA